MSREIQPLGTSEGNAYVEIDPKENINETTLPKERVKTHNPSDVSEITTSGPYEQVSVEAYTGQTSYIFKLQITLIIINVTRLVITIYTCVLVLSFDSMIGLAYKYENTISCTRSGHLKISE